MTKFTPGPWNYTYDHNKKRHAIEAKRGYKNMVFVLSSKGPCRLPDIQLVEAAPSLYSAARDAFEILLEQFNDFDPHGIPPVVLQQLAAALTHADGEERIL